MTTLQERLVKFVEKTDFVKYDATMRKFCKETYCTNEIYIARIEPCII